MAAVTENLGAPDVNKCAIRGKDSHARFWRSHDTVAAALTPSTISGIDTIRFAAPTFAQQEEYFHWSGGDNPAITKRQGTWTGEIIFKSPEYGFDFIQTALGIASIFSVPQNMPEIEVGTLEATLRQYDAATHQRSVAIPRMVISDFSEGQLLDNPEQPSLPFKSYFPWFEIEQGYQLVMDKFTGTGSDTTFSLSGTPVNCADKSTIVLSDLYVHYLLDDIVYCANRATTAAGATVYRSGVSHTGGTLTITTAPIITTQVEVLYVVAN